MKKVLFILSLIPLCSFSQIKTSSVNPEPGGISTSVYDSTLNYLGKDIDLYIGQQLYVPKVTGYEKKNGFEGFKKNIKGDTYESFGYLKKTKYESIAGKYFDVIDVERNTKAYANDVYLKLKEIESGKIIYFDYKSDFDIGFPFVVVGYFEKQKKSLDGVIFPIADYSLTNYVDLETGEKIKPRYFEEKENYYNDWRCIDYTIEEGSKWEEIVILENDKGQKIKLPLKKADEFVDLALKVDGKMKDYDKAIEKYGRLDIGHSNEAVRAILGSPEKINKTTTGYGTSEQWVYKDQYIYFEDGIVTAIQTK